MGTIITVILAFFQIIYVESAFELLAMVIDHHLSNNETINFVMLVATLLLLAIVTILIGLGDYKAIEDPLYFVKDTLITFSCISLIKLLTLKLTGKKSCLHD